MQFLLFAEGIVIFFFAIMQLLAKDKLSTHYLMFFACLALCYLLMYSWATMSGFLLRFPALIGSDVSVVFLIVPVFYLAALSILREGQKPVRNYAAYIVVPVSFAIGSFFYNALNMPSRAKAIGSFPGHFSSPATSVLTFLSVVAVTAAIAGDLVAARRIYKSGLVHQKAEFFNQVFFLIAYFATSLVFWVGTVLRNDRFFIIGFLLFGLVAIAFVFSRTSVFYATQERASPVRPALAKPEWDGTADKLTARLTELMETSAPYQDPDLSLAKLAKMLEVEPKRLSYHLHANLSTSFRAYINDRRLEAVSRDLLRCTDRSILETAFSNGFNSKSSFNTLFVQKYGMTPKEYKKKNCVEQKASHSAR